ncbi:hypothetical protein V8C42DRAFT_334363 [Trichoderma barbatum]
MRILVWLTLGLAGWGADADAIQLPRHLGLPRASPIPCTSQQEDRIYLEVAQACALVGVGQGSDSCPRLDGRYFSLVTF